MSLLDYIILICVTFFSVKVLEPFLVPIIRVTFAVLRRMGIAGEPLFPEARSAIRDVLAAGPLRGYELAKHLRASNPDLFKYREGALYPLLHDMEYRGELTAYAVEESGRTRRYYKLVK